MKSVSIWVTILVGIGGVACGFIVANKLNRSEFEQLRARVGEPKNTLDPNQNGAANDALSDAEIDAKVAEAEQNSADFGFQKSLGLGLYRYGAIKKDKSIIERSIPILQRANSLDAKDYDVIVALGNAFFDVGYFGKDNESFNRSREFYTSALEQKPKDIEVRTDLGLTYFLQEPPDQSAAFAEFEKSLAIDPKHEKTLQFAIQSLVKQGKDASKYIDQLRAINPGNPTLKELTANNSIPPASQ